MRPAHPARDTAALPGLRIRRPERESGLSARARGSAGSHDGLSPAISVDTGACASRVRGARGPALSHTELSKGESLSFLEYCHVFLTRWAGSSKNSGSRALAGIRDLRARGLNATITTPTTRNTRPHPPRHTAPSGLRLTHSAAGSDLAPSTGRTAKHKQREAAGGPGNYAGGGWSGC